MKKSQTKQGKAFEYACLSAIKNYIPDTKIVVVENGPYQTAKNSYEGLSVNEQIKMDFASKAAIKMICELEPRLEFGPNDGFLSLSIQPDSQGKKGDVRDVLCVRSSEHWEIGLSCKHNNDAVKHNRLSGKLDFGAKWLGHPCSEAYFREIRPLFDELAQMRTKSEGKALWSDIENKSCRYYIPVLEAFMNEFKRMSANYKDVPSNLIHYLMGREDFYKVIADDIHRVSKIQAVNICGTLNQGYKGHNPITAIPMLKLPERIFHIGFVPDSDNTIEIICSEGWNVRMRIHNADSLVEPSLKFDIRLIALPSSIYTQMEPWSLVDGYRDRNSSGSKQL